MDKQESVELFKKILKDHNKSITKTRLFVFETLVENRFQSLYEINKKTKCLVNRSSLYRIIEMFQDLRIIEKVPVGWKYKIELSDIFINHHHHITCRSCEKTSVAELNADLEKLIDDIATRADFTLQKHQVEINGICAECQIEKTSSPAKTEISKTVQ